MHKALTQMNLQIHPVISDITGLTGRAIVDAILAGNSYSGCCSFLACARLSCSIADAMLLPASFAWSFKRSRDHQFEAVEPRLDTLPIFPPTSQSAVLHGHPAGL
jgi:hypothetical protein